MQCIYVSVYRMKLPLEYLKGGVTHRRQSRAPLAIRRPRTSATTVDIGHGRRPMQLVSATTVGIGHYRRPLRFTSATIVDVGNGRLRRWADDRLHVGSTTDYHTRRQQILPTLSRLRPPFVGHKMDTCCDDNVTLYYINSISS